MKCLSDITRQDLLDIHLMLCIYEQQVLSYTVISFQSKQVYLFF